MSGLARRLRSMPNLVALAVGFSIAVVAWVALGGLAGASPLEVSADPVGAFSVSADAVHWLIRLGAFTLGVICGR